NQNKSECIRDRYASRALSVSAATFFKCAIAACAPVVLVRRLSVTSSSFTGVSAMSVYIRAAGSRVITSLSKKRRAIIPRMTTCLLSVCQTNRDQKMKARSRGRPGRRSRRMLEPENAALQRMHVLEPHRSRKIDQHLDEAVDGYAGRHRAAQ